MRPSVPAALLLALALSSSACGRDGGGASFGGASEPPVTTAPSDPGDSSSSSSSSSGDIGSMSSSASETSASETGSASTFDMPVPDFPEQSPVGCQGKIDFLFVISSSGTMQGHQQQLAASFPVFMNEIRSKLPDFNVHVMSATTDTNWRFAACSDCASDDCDPEGMLPLCGAERDDCDEVRGAGVRFPIGEKASNKDCGLQSGERYIADPAPDLDEAFSCIGKVGISGTSETAQVMVEAISAEANGPTGCNAGFLRDDALLVVTLIDDSFDEFSTGNVASWIESLRLAKKGDDDAYVVLVLTTDVDKGPWELCHPGEYSETKNRLRLLADGVEHGFIGSICEESYDQFFSQTVESVVNLCEDFVPPPG